MKTMLGILLIGIALFSCNPAGLQQNGAQQKQEVMKDFPVRLENHDKFLMFSFKDDGTGYPLWIAVQDTNGVIHIRHIGY